MDEEPFMQVTGEWAIPVEQDAGMSQQDQQAFGANGVEDGVVVAEKWRAKEVAILRPCERKGGQEQHNNVGVRTGLARSGRGPADGRRSISAA
jgi:hypothetical protein